MVRLKWWGLYHDKPKVGSFMLRIKLPGGLLTPAQLRAIGEISTRFGRGDGELTTRQNVQLHWIELAALPGVFALLDAAGLTTAGACGDTVRNITGCPVAGVAHDELFDATPVLEEAAAFFYGHPDYSDLPRKHKITISACRDRCNAPEINCISLVGVVHEGREGFAVLAGGGLSSVPRTRARPRRLRAQGGSARGPARAPRRLARGPHLPRLAREVADEVHGRRLRPRGRARRGRAPARPRARGLRASAAARDVLRPRRSAPAAASRALLRRHARPSRPRLGRADGRRRGPGRAPRRRRPRHAPAELRAHRRARGAGRRHGRRARARSASRSTSTTCAPPPSPAPASRTATSR